MKAEQTRCLNDCIRWAVDEITHSRQISAQQLLSFGQSPRQIINSIRYLERIPVRTRRRINCAVPQEHKSTAWDMLADEVHRFNNDRLKQIADMTEQANARTHRKECRQAKALLIKLGLAVPDEIERGAALNIPHISEGKSR